MTLYVDSSIILVTLYVGSSIILVTLYVDSSGDIVCWQFYHSGDIVCWQFYHSGDIVCWQFWWRCMLTVLSFWWHFMLTVLSFWWQCMLTVLSFWWHFMLTVPSFWWQCMLTVLSFWWQCMLTVLSFWWHFMLTVPSVWWHWSNLSHSSLRKHGKSSKIYLTYCTSTRVSNMMYRGWITDSQGSNKHPWRQAYLPMTESVYDPTQLSRTNQLATEPNVLSRHAPVNVMLSTELSTVLLNRCNSIIALPRSTLSAITSAVQARHILRSVLSGHVTVVIGWDLPLDVSDSPGESTAITVNPRQSNRQLHARNGQNWKYESTKSTVFQEESLSWTPNNFPDCLF